MAYLSCGTAYLDKGEYFSKKCMNCGKESERSEVIHNGEEFEGWSYCRECDIETFHPILTINTPPNETEKENS